MSVPKKIDVAVEDSLDTIYVHPLFFVAGFVAHTAITVLLTLYVFPLIVTSVGLSMATMAVYWLMFAGVTLTFAVAKQRGIN